MYGLPPPSLTAVQYDFRNNQRFYFEVGFVIDPDDIDAPPPSLSFDTSTIKRKVENYNPQDKYAYYQIGIDSYSIRHRWFDSAAPAALGFIESNRFDIDIICDEIIRDNGNRSLVTLPYDSGQGLGSSSSVGLSKIPDIITFRLGILSPLPNDLELYTPNFLSPFTIPTTTEPLWSSQYIKSIRAKFFIQGIYEPRYSFEDSLMTANVPELNLNPH